MGLPRLHLFELEDLRWFPTIVRDYSTDYLQHMQDRLDLHESMVPVLREALSASGARRVVDLCSGGSGPLLAIAREVNGAADDVRFTLTDRFPNRAAFERIAAASNGAIDYSEVPIDARAVPSDLDGVRTLFNAFHHFAPADATAILRDAVAARQPICVFEIPDRRLFAVLSFVTAPFIVLAVTPFIRPFRWRRLLLTYLLPAVPLTCLWDGIVSQLRAYTPKELRAMANEADPQGQYHWNVGRVPVHSLPVRLTYLAGYPRTADPAGARNE